MAMRLNDDLGRRAILETAAMAWEDSPAPGVFRKRLDRDGGEVARATSLVRYAPGSVFAPHVHGGGEEILVLDGVFSDESGHYPAGTYLRNPPGSRHAPFSRGGCTLFVKLRQFAGDDRLHATIDTAKGEWRPGRVPGVEVMTLYSHGTETVLLVRWRPGVDYPWHEHPGGEEIFLLEGNLEDEHGRYPQGTWLRQPPGSSHKPSSAEGALLFVKLGHLASARPASDAASRAAETDRPRAGR